MTPTSWGIKRMIFRFNVSKTVKAKEKSKCLDSDKSEEPTRRERDELLR